MPDQTPEQLAQLAALTAVGVAVAATPLEVSRRYTRRAFSVLRVAAGLAASADADIAALGRQLQRIIGGADLGELGRRELIAMLREISAAVAETYTGLAAAQTAAARQVLAIEAGWAAGVLGGQSPSPSLMARMERGLLVLGATPAEQWSRQGETLAERVADAVREGAATGVPVREAVADIVSTAQRDGRALADVTTTSAAAQGRAEVARANGMIGFRWIAVLDSRTTTGCAIRNGLVYSLDYQPIGHNIPIERPPPRHWGCLLGDTHVSACGRITGMFERIYDGEIIVLRTAAGDQISVTPNHPILTDRGWVAAGLLDVGCNVVSSGLGQWVANRSNADGEHVPARIEDMANALRGSGDMGSVPVPLSPEDFHGDGGGSDVAVVWTDGNLGDRIYAALTQHVGEDNLSFGHAAGHLELTGDGSALQGFHSVGAASLGLVGGGSVSLPLFGSEPGSPDDVGLAAAAQPNAVAFENTHDGHHGHPVPFGEDGGAVTSQVFGAYLLLGKGEQSDGRNAEPLDDSVNRLDVDANLARDLIGGDFGPVFFSAIVDKFSRQFSGHVYNLETDSGAFVSNGIITHNCRSILVALRRMPREGDADIDVTFEQWIDSLSPAEQDDVLGAGRADLWRRGVITKADLISQRGRTLTLAELRARVD